MPTSAYSRGALRRGREYEKPPFGGSGGSERRFGFFSSRSAEARVLYVGNTTANGELNSADLEKATQQLETTFAARVTAAAAISPVHLLVALEGGELQRFNTLTKEATLVLDLDADVTSLSHDKFSGLVYAGLSTLEIVAIQPFKGEVMPFDTMPGKGRVAVSPSGRLWFMPVKYIQAGTLVSFDLPNEL